MTSLFQRVLGPQFAALPPELQRFHSLAGRTRLVGRCITLGAESAPARWLGRLLGLPVAGTEGAIEFRLEAGPDAETWERRFPGTRMISRLRLRERMVIERLGPVTLSMALEVRDGRLLMNLARVSVLGLPWPMLLSPRVRAEETAAGGRLQFDVEAGLPGIGRIAGYRGHLDLATAESLS